jgi:hypothetical protein
MNEFRCAVCGKYIGFNEMENNEINTKYTPDSDYSIEQFEYEHKRHNLSTKIK